MNFPRVTQIQRCRDAKLGQCLLRRPSRMREVASSLGPGSPTGRFRYVGTDGQRRAYELIRPARGTGSPQRATQAGRVHGDLERQLVNL